uniref:Vacuolar protein sorting-associated protein 26C n=1 Tax=Phallusia mammillata TaxID=59560 RepID=A0A6F9DWT6_9ASCI|nr:Down syndrome critical region protein 3 homolog [Phallusia mammillata]
MATIDIKLDRHTKIYHETETVRGVIVVTSKNSLVHQGISLTCDGVVALTLSAKNVGRIEALYNSVKPVYMFSYATEAEKSGKLPPGKTEIPFEFVLKSKGSNKHLFETYHGVYITVQYTIKCVMKRPLLSKDLNAENEFLVELKSGAKSSVKQVPFTINRTSVQNVNTKANIPRFSIRGKLDSSQCCILRPFTGEFVVEHSETAIQSVELQLLRVETVGSVEGFAREVSTIQNIEIGSGDICRGLTVPIYMIFPRLFSCPTLDTTNFKIEFEVNIVVVFEDDSLVMENFPITITRF